MLADIPGLIEGAHEGAGLGDRFLGHVERCAVLLHLVDGTAGDVVRACRTVRDELAAYGGGLADKPEIDRAEQDRRDDAARGVGAPRGAGEGVRAAGACCSPASPARACRRCCARCSRRCSRRGATGGARRRRHDRPRSPPPGALVVKIGSALLVDARRGRAPPRLARRRRRRHRRAARARRRRDRGLLRRHRAGAPRARPARSAGCGSRRSRPPPPPARSASRRPGARRCPRTASPSRRCC